MRFLARLFRTPTSSKGPVMAVPVITSATLDAASYATGQTATLTVVRGDTSSTSTTDSLSVTVTDNVTGEVASETVTLTVASSTTDATTVAVSDSSGRVWSQASDDGATAVFTATV